jgi:hypothetical protein
MRTRTPRAARDRVNRALVACGLVGLALASAARAEPVLIERILAVVDGRPVLLSEVRVVEWLTGQDRERALEALIDERLMFREASRLPQAALTTDEETRARESLRARGGDAIASLPERDLRHIARRQAMIVKYVEFRFRPQVRVDEQAVRRAYDLALSEGAARPEFEAVAPELRQRLAEEDLRQRIEAWIQELRRGADVRYNLVPSPATARPGS